MIYLSKTDDCVFCEYVNICNPRFVGNDDVGDCKKRVLQSIKLAIEEINRNKLP